MSLKYKCYNTESLRYYKVELLEVTSKEEKRRRLEQKSVTRQGHNQRLDTNKEEEPTTLVRVSIRRSCVLEVLEVQEDEGVWVRLDSTAISVFQSSLSHCWSIADSSSESRYVITADRGHLK